jgi:16S rRNA processing protein RimM
MRGELKCRIVTDFPEERFRAGARLLVGPDLQTFTLRSARLQGEMAYLELEGIDGRDAAETLRGAEVLVPADQAVTLPEGQFYWHQVIGLRVEDATTGETLGTVAEILETGANHVYVVRGGRHGEVLIPVIKDVVKSIDPATGKILVEPLPGLLPE